MIALLFIFVMTWLGIETSTRFSQEVTWFTYYVGGVFGLFASGMGLEFWTKWKLREKDPEKTRKKRAVSLCTIKDHMTGSTP